MNPSRRATRGTRWLRKLRLVRYDSDLYIDNTDSDDEVLIWISANIYAVVLGCFQRSSEIYSRRNFPQIVPEYDDEPEYGRLREIDLPREQRVSHLGFLAAQAKAQKQRLRLIAKQQQLKLYTKGDRNAAPTERKSKRKPNPKRR